MRGLVLAKIAIRYRTGWYVALNFAFVAAVGVGAALGACPDPRSLYLVLLFALCSSPMIDIGRFNGPLSLLALFMLVYFVSYGVVDFTNLFMPADASSITSGPVHGGGLTQTEVVILLGGIMLTLGYRLAVLAADSRTRTSSPKDWSKRAVLVVGPILWMIGTYATYTWYVYIVPGTTDDVVRKGLASVSTLTASAYILGQMMQPLGLLLLAYALRVFDTRYLLPFVIAVVVLQVALGFVVDIKGMAMLGGILVIMTTVLVDGRVPKGWLAAFVLFVIFVFPVFQAYRSEIRGERGLARTTVIQNFGKVLQLTLAAEHKVNSGQARAQTFLERSSLKFNTQTIVENTGHGVDYQRGHTLSPLLSTFVPRIIWSDKPDVPTGQLVNKLFHMTDSDDIFISPSYLGELYWNFGWPGVVLGMGVLGAICGWIGARFNLPEYRTVTRILVTAVTIKQLIVGFEGAIANNTVFWLRSLAAIGLLHLTFAKTPVRSRLPQPASDANETPRDQRLYPNLLT